MFVWLSVCLGVVAVGELAYLGKMGGKNRDLIAARDEIWKGRVKRLREGLREQWAVEEAKISGQLTEARQELALAHDSIRELTGMLVKLASDAVAPDALIREFGTQIVRLTQGEITQLPTNGENLADLMGSISGETQDETAGDALFVPDHELEILAWANDAMPTRGGFYNQEKAAGAEEGS